MIDTLIFLCIAQPILFGIVIVMLIIALMKKEKKDD